MSKTSKKSRTNPAGKPGKPASSSVSRKVTKIARAAETAVAVTEAVKAAKEMKDAVKEAISPAPKPSRLEKFMPWLLVVGGVFGIISAFVISYDKDQLLQNASFQPNCDLNPIISCGSVMKSSQGAAFGFPNPWVGLAAFAVLIAIGMAIFAGGKFKRWFWIGLQAGTVFGLAFVHWLFFQSVYRIGALCPYCMVVWVVVITTFWYTLLYNLEQKVIVLPAKFQKVGFFMRRHHLDILVLWFVIIIALILKHFWYFYSHYLGF